MINYMIYYNHHFLNKLLVNSLTAVAIPVHSKSTVYVVFISNKSCITSFNFFPCWYQTVQQYIWSLFINWAVPGALWLRSVICMERQIIELLRQHLTSFSQWFRLWWNDELMRRCGFQFCTARFQLLGCRWSKTQQFACVQEETLINLLSSKLNRLHTNM